MITFTNGHYLNAQFEWQEFSSISVQNNKIVAINEAFEASGQTRTIDASNQFLAPAFIDLYQTLPANEASANITMQAEAQAAAAAGYKAICVSPDTHPINQSKAVTHLIAEFSKDAQGAHILPLGALTQDLAGTQLAEHAELKEAGCIALSNALTPLNNLAVTKRCLEYAKTYDIPISLHPMEPSLYNGSMNSGSLATSLGLKGISPLAESIAVSQLIMLAQSSKVRLHLTQISCAQSVALIRDAKKSGVNISADVAIANLLFTEAQINGFNSDYHCLPPLRTETDRQSLIEGLKDGTIDAICSAHTPLEEADKLAPFAESKCGMSTIDKMLSFGLSLANKGELDISTFLKAITSAPSKVLGLTENHIEVGQAADLVLFSKDQTISRESSIVSAGKNTPNASELSTGSIRHTLINGILR